MSVPSTIHLASRFALTVALALGLTAFDYSLPGRSDASSSAPAAQVTVVGAPVTAFVVTAPR